jgi:hypothetical protein
MNVFVQVTGVYSTVQDRHGPRESTSQAENAGSIPVIGSALTSSNAVRTVRTGSLGVTGAERDGVGPAGSSPTQVGTEVGDEQREGSEQE